MTDRQTYRQTDRQTKFMLRSLERGLFTLAPMTLNMSGTTTVRNHLGQ